MPRRPLIRILLLLAVAGVAIGIAGALFSGEEAVARDPAAPNVPTATPSAPPADGPSLGGATAENGDLPGDDSVVATSGPAPPSESTPDSATSSPAPPGAETESSPPTAADNDSTRTAETPAPAETTGTPTTTPPAATPAAEGPAPVAGEPPAPEAAVQLIEQLRPLVAEPDPNAPDYDRYHFAGWLDADGDCVNTRHEILQVDAIDFSMNAAGCSVASGEWFDLYTDRTYTNPRDLDVDHVVALADAWVSGAWAWADELLDNFSNDFGNLNAIAAGENRSKSARGPGEYSPTAPGARCAYLVQYATVKIRWGLAITPRDFEVVATGLAGCDVGIVPDPAAAAPAAAPSPAPPTAAPPPAPPTTISTQPASDCHPAYEPCLPNLSGDALNCGDLRADQRPVTVLQPGTDPYRLDRDGDGRGCTG